MLKRIEQYGLKIESSEGVAETLAAADFAGVFKEASAQRIVTRYERGESKASLSKSPDLMGASLLEVSITKEMAGLVAGTSDVPHYDALLRCMGFARTQLKVITTDFEDGFPIGSILDNGAGATGLVVRSIGFQTVYVPLTGAFGLGETVTDSVNMESGEVTVVPADAGKRYTLVSETDSVLPPSATQQYRIGGQWHTAAGCRARGSIMFRHGQPPLIQAVVRGVELVNTSGAPLTGVSMASVPAPQTPMMIGKLGFPFLLDAYSPILTDLSIEIGNELADRPTIGSGGILGADINTTARAVGYMAVRIGDRTITATIDPEHVAAGTFDFAGRWHSGAVWPLRADFGRPTDAAGMIVVSGPTVQLSGEQQSVGGERNGILIHNAQLKFCGDSDEELVVDHIKL